MPTDKKKPTNPIVNSIEHTELLRRLVIAKKMVDMHRHIMTMRPIGRGVQQPKEPLLTPQEAEAQTRTRNLVGHWDNCIFKPKDISNGTDASGK